MIGELAARLTEGAIAAPADAVALLDGYAGEPHHIWADGQVALAASGAADLAVFDDLVVLVDGRLDNRADIVQASSLQADVDLSVVVAEGWRRFGAGLVDRLVGDLAVIVVDRRTGTLCAFRDICAGRPLHVSRDAHGWAVATEWQPLAAVRPNRRPNREWFASAMIGYSLNPKATAYHGVEIVLPGHLATPDQTGWNQRRAASWHIPELRDTRQGAYAEQFRHHLDDAVRARLNGRTNRIGVALSGGLDSTSVLASAYAVAPNVGRVALCLPLTDPAGDERSVQEHMARRCDSELRWIDMEELGPFGTSGPDALFDRVGAPPASVNWFYPEALAEEARRAGVAVAFDGEDGDGSFGGNTTYLADLMVRGRWGRWLGEVNAMRARQQVSGRDMIRESLHFNAPPFLRRMFQGAAYVPTFVSDTLRRDLDLETRVRRSFLVGSWSPGRMFAQSQSEVGEAYHMTGRYTVMSEPWRRRGVELSHPLADRRFMSFCMGLPYMHVRSMGMGKIVLREAMTDRLPRELLVHHGKADMSEVFMRGVRGRDSATVKAGLTLALEQPEWFAPAGVRELQDGFEAGELHSLTPAARVAMFARWLRWCDAA